MANDAVSQLEPGQLLVQAAAFATALSQVGDQRLIDPLVRMLRDSSPCVRCPARTPLPRSGWRTNVENRSAVRTR
jgi:HEAT repeat protein